MGCVLIKQSDNGDRVNLEINEDIRKAKKKTGQHKLLLLGPGESGKSTIFNQLKIISNGHLENEELESKKQVVLNNLLTTIQSLIEGARKLNIPILNEDLANRFMEIKNSVNLPNYVNDINTIWEDVGIQNAYSSKNQFQLIDQAKYFIDNAKRICGPNFIPSEDDVIHCRAKTAAIVELEIFIGGNTGPTFRIIDVGGPRNERKKWIHFFEGVTAVIYVTSLSEYDQKLEEDDYTNRIVESLNLFEETINSKWFKNSHIILFLNKKDLFKEKIKTNDPKIIFPDYTGGCDEVAAMEYIKNQFVSRNKNQKKKISVRETCAIDKDNIDFVFKSVRDVVFQENVTQLFN